MFFADHKTNGAEFMGASTNYRLDRQNVGLFWQKQSCCIVWCDINTYLEVPEEKIGRKMKNQSDFTFH